MRNLTIVLFFILGFSVLGQTPVEESNAPIEETNEKTTQLLKNPSFEETTDGKPSDWTNMYWDKTAGGTKFEVITGGAQDGNRYVKITNIVANDSRYLQKIQVQPNSNYKISCWVKTQNVGKNNKGANISIYGELYTSKDLTGTYSDWEPLNVYLRTGTGITETTITVGLGGYASVNKGEVSIDNITVEKIETIPGGETIFDLKKKVPTQETEKAVEIKKPQGLGENIATLLGFQKDNPIIQNGKKVPQRIYTLAITAFALIILFIVYYRLVILPEPEKETAFQETEEEKEKTE